MNKNDFYITFYQVSGDTMIVSNGFSFGRENQSNYTDIFIDRNSSPKTVSAQMEIVSSEADRIFASISISDDLEIIRPYIDHRWIIGGNVYSTQKNTSLAQTGDVENTQFTVTSLPLEQLLGGPETPYSSIFSSYFEELFKQSSCKNLLYNCTIGQGCYWGKCEFCGFRVSNCKRYIRKNSIDILSSLLPNTNGGTSEVHLGIPSIYPSMLRDVLSVSWPETLFPVIFIRADLGIINVLESFNNEQQICRNKKFCLGMEILSDTALAVLKKGVTVDSILNTIKLLLSHGALVELEIMDDYPFLNEEIVSEVQHNCRRLQEIYSSYKGPSNYIWIYNNGPVCWPSEAIARSFSQSCEVIPPMHEFFGEGESTPSCLPLYRCVISEDSLQQDYNARIREAIEGIGITLMDRDRYK